ncbi:hypothetical protein D3C73_899600 [compost metagenome]
MYLQLRALLGQLVQLAYIRVVVREYRFYYRSYISVFNYPHGRKRTFYPGEQTAFLLIHQLEHSLNLCEGRFIHPPGIFIILHDQRSKGTGTKEGDSSNNILINESSLCINNNKQLLGLEAIIAILLRQLRYRLMLQHLNTAIKAVHGGRRKLCLKDNSFAPIQIQIAAFLFRLTWDRLTRFIHNRQRKRLLPVLVLQHKFTLKYTFNSKGMRIVD